MKFSSPHPINECRSILSEQIGTRRTTTLLGSLTSRVVGSIDGNRVRLECGIDRFSKRFVGMLHENGNATVLEGEWIVPFWSGIWGDHKIDEQEILGFLKSYAAFEQTA